METARSRARAAFAAALLIVPSLAFSDTFTFSTERMTTVLAKGKEHTILSGNAVVTSGSTRITANQIELYGTDFQYADCTGDVTAVDKEKEITLTADNLFYDRTADLSRVEGYAEMEDRKNQLVVKGGFLENRGKDEITIIEIGVRILKVSEGKQMACRSEFARYDRAHDMLELSGMPVVFWKGDEYRADRITINLKTDEIHLEGDVSGSVKTETSSAQQGGAAAGSSGAAGSSAPGSDGTSTGTSSSTAPAPSAAPSTGAPAPSAAPQGTGSGH